MVRKKRVIDIRDLEPKRISYPITSKGHADWERAWNKWWGKYIEPIFKGK